MSPGMPAAQPGYGRSPASLAEIHELSAVQLRDALRSGELSARQATDHFLDRIEAQNPHLGAFITVTAEQARKRRRGSGPAPRPPEPERRRLAPAAWNAGRLQGPDGCGRGRHHAWKRRPGAQTGPGRRRAPAALKAAGVISLGKTQVPEFGLTAYSENRIAPPSRNPYALSRSSGGSSGGSAAAVAAGLLPFAPGSDGGGSVRIPAAACGLVGLKPGRGLVPAGESIGDPAAARGCRTARPLRRRRRAAARCPGAGPATRVRATGCGRSGQGSRRTPATSN